MSRQWLYSTLDKKSYFHFLETGELDEIIVKYIGKQISSTEFMKNKNKFVFNSDSSSRKKGYCYCGSFTMRVLTKDGWMTICDNTQQSLKLCKK
ncbi:translin-associated factor X-like protein [Saudi moumouvirus]|nr:translin-associated factor X-like protein [Saudi moumouvirus]